jgi:mannose-6-phosphate isomerase-like protein (cupin superfamily)
MKVDKPWGYYKVLHKEPGYQIKEIMVKSGQRLSLQSHKHRDEHWVIIQGYASIVNGTDLLGNLLSYGKKAGEYIFIRRGKKHRVKNVQQEDLIFIEIQTGDYLEEDDIVRYEDDYDRLDK